MDPVRVGMIGAGRHANSVHFPSLAEIPEARIDAVCDLDKERLKATSDRYGIESRFVDYRQMLKKVNLDVLYIIMAQDLILPIVMYALRKRKHIFIEKPPGADLRQTETMAREAKKNKCLTMVGFNRRFVPVLAKAKSIVEEMGEIIRCHAAYHKCVPSSGFPKGSPYKDFLTSDVIHAVDVLRWVGGEVKDVEGVVGRYYDEVPNSFNAMFRFRNGGIGTLDSCYATGGRVQTYEMHARGVSAYIDTSGANGNQKAMILREGQAYEQAEILRSIDVDGSDKWHRCFGYYHENLHFIRCIRENKEPQTSIEDSTKTMEIVQRILKSRQRSH